MKGFGLEDDWEVRNGLPLTVELVVNAIYVGVSTRGLTGGAGSTVPPPSLGLTAAGIFVNLGVTKFHNCFKSEGNLLKTSVGLAGGGGLTG